MDVSSAAPELAPFGDVAAPDARVNQYCNRESDHADIAGMCAA